MRALVTGGLGFIGSHLVESLVARGDEVSILDNYSRGELNDRIFNEMVESCKSAAVSPIVFRGNVTDLEVVTKAMEGVDVVFHLAALISHRTALERPLDYLEQDALGTATVLEGAKLMTRKPLVFFASSNKVYGNQIGPWHEEMPLEPEGPYALGKLTAEQVCEMYSKYLGVPTVVGRFHHVIGKRTSPDLVVSLFTSLALKGEPLEVFGEVGKEGFESCSANYTHVDDVVRATLLCVEKYQGFDIFNIANQKETFILDMAKRVIEKTGSSSEIKLVQRPEHEALQNISLVQKAKDRLGFVAEIPVERAIDEYLEWRLHG